MNIIKQIKDSDGNNIYPIGYAQGGMKMDLLWTNPSPTSSFASQTVSIDFSDYDNILLVSYVFADGSTLYYQTDILNKVQTHYILTASNRSSVITRRINNFDDSSITFDQGYVGTSANNATFIPTQIYGIKMSYIVPTSVHGLQYVEV